MKFNEHKIKFCKSQPDFKNVLESFLEEVEGSALCDCGHGCRDFIADNAAKILAILRATQSGNVSQITLDAMAEKDPTAYTHELHAEMWERAKERRETKS